MEELSDGTLITHIRGVELEQMHRYCRAVFIPAVPPRFVVRRI